MKMIFEFEKPDDAFAALAAAISSKNTLNLILSMLREEYDVANRNAQLESLKYMYPYSVAPGVPRDRHKMDVLNTVRLTADHLLSKAEEIAKRDSCATVAPFQVFTYVQREDGIHVEPIR